MNTTNVSVSTKTKSRKRRARSNQKKKKQQPQKRQRNNRQPGGAGGRRMFMLSPCAKKYLLCLSDPFNPVIVDPCVPDMYDFPSWKFKTLIRGTLAIGTLGYGFVFTIPKAAFFNDANYLWYSGSNFASDAIETAGTGVNLVKNWSAPRNYAELVGAYNQMRLVGSGLRIRYSGTELNRGGTVAMTRLICPKALVAGGAFTQPYVLQDQRARSFPCTRAWRTVAWNPINADDYAFQFGDRIEYNNNNATCDLCFMIKGTPGESYEFESINFFEYIGAELPSVTKSDCDLPGFSAVRDASGDTAVTPEAGPSYSDRLLKVIQWASETQTSGVVAASVANKILAKAL